MGDISETWLAVVCQAAQPAERISACSKTVRVAASWLSGAYPCLCSTRFTSRRRFPRTFSRTVQSMLTLPRTRREQFAGDAGQVSVAECQRALECGYFGEVEQRLAGCGTPIVTRIRREQGNREPERGAPGLDWDRDRRALFARDKDSYREQPTCRNRTKQSASTPPFIALGSLALPCSSLGFDARLVD